MGEDSAGRSIASVLGWTGVLVFGGVLSVIAQLAMSEGLVALAYAPIPLYGLLWALRLIAPRLFNP